MVTNARPDPSGFASTRADEELATIRRRFAAIASWVVLLLLPISETLQFLRYGPLPSLALSVCQALASVAVLLLLKRHARFAFGLLASVMAGTTLVRAALDGGVSTAAFASYGMLVVVTTLLLGRGGGLAVASVGVVGGALLHVGFDQGLLAATARPPATRDLVVHAFSFLGAAVLVGYFGAALTRAMRRSSASEAEAGRARERYTLAAWGARYGAWEWAPETDALWLAAEVQSLRGFPPAERRTTGADFLRSVHPADQAGLAAELRAAVKLPSAKRRHEFRVRGQAGDWIWVESHHQATDACSSRRPRLLGALRDVTESRLTAEVLHRQAFYDGLTGLPNRTLFLDRLGQTLRRARRRDRADWAVLFIDLDRFKLVNDSLGHPVGDRLLAEFATRLRGAVRDTDTASRLGGDEFAVLLEDADPDRLHQVTRRIRGLVDAPFHFAEREVFVGASVGVLRGEVGYEDPLDAVRDADLAMYSAKGGDGSVGWFHPRLRLQARRLQALDSALRRALAEGTIEAWFQPIVDLKTRELAGFEALARRRLDDGGVDLPQEFVPRAEETGAIVEIDHHMLRTAAAEAMRWPDPDGRGPRLHVNLSARSFHKVELLEVVSGCLRDSGLPPRRLQLELTERILLEDLTQVRERLRALRALGVGVAVDDFGTGYSSFGVLHRLRPECLKIDRGFVQEKGASGPGPICRAIHSMATSLGLETIAEGVETEAQRRALVELGCRTGQGWLFGAVLPPEEAARLAGNGPGRIPA